MQDQTQFSQIEPVYEDVYLPQEPPQPPTEEDIALEKAKRQRTWLLLGIGFGLCIVCLFVIVALFFVSNNQSVTQQIEEPIVVEEPLQESSIFSTQLRQIEDRINEIDPVTDFVTVPSVDYTLRLE